MEFRPAALAAASLLLAAIGCGKSPPSRVRVHVVNQSNELVKVEDTRVNAKSFGLAMLDANAKSVKFWENGQEQRADFKGSRESDYLLRFGSSGTVLLLDMADAYEGGGVIAFASGDDGFPIVERFSAPGLTEFHVRPPYFVVYPGEKAPDSVFAGTRVLFLCAVNEALAKDEKRAHDGCLALAKKSFR